MSRTRPLPSKPMIASPLNGKTVGRAAPSRSPKRGMRVVRPGRLVSSPRSMCTGETTKDGTSWRAASRSGSTARGRSPRPLGGRGAFRSESHLLEPGSGAVAVPARDDAEPPGPHRGPAFPRRPHARCGPRGLPGPWFGAPRVGGAHARGMGRGKITGSIICFLFDGKSPSVAASVRRTWADVRATYR